MHTADFHICRVPLSLFSLIPRIPGVFLTQTQGVWSCCRCVPRFADCVVLSPGVAHQCYHGFIKAVQEGNIQWESRTYPYPGTPITQRFSHSEYPLESCRELPLCQAVPSPGVLLGAAFFRAGSAIPWSPDGSCLPWGLAVPPVPVTAGVEATAVPTLSTRAGIWELLVMVGSLIVGNADGVEVGWDCGFLVVQGSSAAAQVGKLI